MNTVKKITAQEAKTYFSKLLDDVASGAKIIITRHGKPVAEMNPPPARRKQAKIGCAKSPNFYTADDFDAPLEVFKDYM